MAPTPEARGTPQRTCIGCGQVRPASRLTRLARTADGGIAVGPGHPGRGAWLCRDAPACFELAVRKRAIPRALRASIDAAEIDVVRSTLGYDAPIA